ncbi:MAG TPA: FtsK/SpoIIIE domain-containing protein [Verrucomicrobiae bacterium]|nr:FtsK/SpoIIIE domain-containing protein [Verrucomicrobiae bacterium]
MNKQLGVDQMLALLDTLNSTVQSFVAREEKLTGEFRSQTTAAQNALAEQSRAQTAFIRAKEVESENALEAARVRLQERFEERRARITRAHSNVNQQVSDHVAQHDIKSRERTQQGVLAAETYRDEELVNATTAYNQFQQNAVTAGEELDRLETATRSAFRGYGKFRRMLSRNRPWPEPDLSASHDQFYLEFQSLQTEVAANLEKFAAFPLPRLFRFIPVWLVVIVLGGIAAADPIGAHFGRPMVPHAVAAGALVALLLVVTVHFIGGQSSTPLAKSIAASLAKMRRLLDAGIEKSGTHLQAEQARLHAEFEAAKQNFNREWRQSVRDLTNSRTNSSGAITEKSSRIARKNEAWHRAQTAQLQSRFARAAADIKTQDAAQAQELANVQKNRMAQFEEKYQRQWQELESDWNQQITPLYAQLQAAQAVANAVFPPWDDASWKNWMPPREFQNAAKFGQLEGGVEKFVGSLPKDGRLKWPGPATLSAPLSLVFPTRGSLLFESGKSGGEEAFGAINDIIFRLLATTPPGKLSFTIFDPVGLGQNFSALMHLADYEESSINSRIWTQAAQFEEKLAELNEHMEKIIQMYLRNEYATIAEYNAQAGSVAEKYHFLVIGSFPVNFSETAARRLRNIAASGARCGVFTLIHWDQRTALPQEFVPDELRASSVCLLRTPRGFELAAGQPSGVQLVLDPPPSPELATEFLHQVGQGSKDANRVEVPFAQIAPAESEMWTEQTAALLRVPIGRSGATKLQYLEVGSGTRQHALIAGKTGSGKSTLFHVLITNLALRCSPEEVEFYLVDFKKGVEFKCYGSRRLPHARVVAIESDREFGLSVLQRVDDELRRRGDMFRKLGAQDLPGYKRAGGTESVPRTLLIIDEFQEFFTEEDRISQGAAVLLDRIVRQGRAFGIHVLMGSQTLGGAYTLARATIGQMVIRIALQCNEADAYLIMDQDNPAPRLLSRPGEGIYNDAAGAIEGNSPFQTVWLPDTVRDDYLAKIRDRADRAADDGKEYPGPIVFEGNAPADVRENLPLRAALQKPATQVPTQASVWIGAPNSIKGPTEAIFRRQSGSNLLVAGQSEERTATLVAVALVSLAAQYPADSVRFVVLDSTPPGLPQRELLERIIKAVPHQTIQGTNGNLAEVMGGLAEEMKRREGNEATGPEIFVLIQGLQNFKKLRQEDEFSFSSSRSDAPNPAAILQNLITEGPARGIHVIVTCDTYNNINRSLGRKMLSEFEMRVVFQMSASDSASLIDSPTAATLGLNRALYYNDREGSLETFRPYAQPDNEWVEGSVVRSKAT